MKTTKEDHLLSNQLEQIIKRIGKIQKRIAATGEPVSQFDIAELEGLGREYSRIVHALKQDRSDQEQPRNS